MHRTEKKKATIWGLRKSLVQKYKNETLMFQCHVQYQVSINYTNSSSTIKQAQNYSYFSLSWSVTAIHAGYMTSTSKDGAYSKCGMLSKCNQVPNVGPMG